MRFMAMASVSCASRLIEPKDMAPVLEALDDLGGRLDLLERNRLAGLELQQAAQRAELRAASLTELRRTA
jgi:hypothetical protein